MLSGVSGIIEVGSSILDLVTDVKVSHKPWLSDDCEVLEIMDRNCPIPVSECSYMISRIPYFSALSLTVTILPWLLGFVIILSNQRFFSEIWERIFGNKGRVLYYISQFFLWVSLVLFPVTIFMMLGYWQYQLNLMRRMKRPGDQEKMRQCEKDVKFLAKEGSVAAKSVEVATESSLGPFIQLFILITTCHIFEKIERPQEMGFSDLTFSVSVSIIMDLFRTSGSSYR